MTSDSDSTMMDDDFDWESLDVPLAFLEVSRAAARSNAVAEFDRATCHHDIDTNFRPTHIRQPCLQNGPQSLALPIRLQSPYGGTMRGRPSQQSKGWPTA